MNALIKEAAMTPVREIPTEELMKMEDTSKIRGIEVKDFKSAMKVIVPSVSNATMHEFDQWRKEKGQ